MRWCSVPPLFGLLHWHSMFNHRQGNFRFLARNQNEEVEHSENELWAEQSMQDTEARQIEPIAKLHNPGPDMYVICTIYWTAQFRSCTNEWNYTHQSSTSGKKEKEAYLDPWGLLPPAGEGESLLLPVYPWEVETGPVSCPLPDYTIIVSVLAY